MSSSFAIVCPLLLLISLTSAPIQAQSSQSHLSHHNSERRAAPQNGEATLISSSSSSLADELSSAAFQQPAEFSGSDIDLARQQKAAESVYGTDESDQVAGGELSAPMTGAGGDNLASPTGDFEGDSGRIGGQATGGGQQNQDEVVIENSHEIPDSRNLFIDHQRHNSQMQAMHDLFERRQLANQHHQSQSFNQHPGHHMNGGGGGGGHHHQLPASQELSPISIGLGDSGAGNAFNMPFQDANLMPPKLSGALNPLSNSDSLGPDGPPMPFNLNGPSIPQLLSFQAPPPVQSGGPVFDGPQRGDQSAHSLASASSPSGSDVADQPSVAQKIWPKIFRFTDGRINLSDFEKQKKIRLSSKNQLGENHIESAPIMFDGRQLKRKSFLILHGGIFS